MKRYLSNFKLTENFVLKSMLECLSHKTNNKVRWDRKDTSYFLADYYIKGGFAESENLHETANFIHNDIHNNFTFYHDVLTPSLRYRDGLCKQKRQENRQDKEDTSIHTGCLLYG